MTEAKSCAFPYCLIPLSSEEPLWEWDIVSDYFFMSAGALKALNLSSPPRRMKDFHKLLPPGASCELSNLRETVIAGKTGSVMECGYLCNGRWVREYLMVLTRNSQGRATRVMGRFSASAAPMGQMEFRVSNSGLPEYGIWVLDVEKGKIWNDALCAAYSNNAEKLKYPIPPDENYMNVHPSEVEALKRHYDQFCSGASLGDNISDIVRVRNHEGEYVPILLRATALERDDAGKALLVAGTVTTNNPTDALADKLGQDDLLFHALMNMGGGQWNWDTKEDCIYFCPRFLAMLGYTPDDARDFIKNWRSHIHPDDYQKVRAAQQAVIDNKENGDSFECTYRMRRADGSWAWIFDRGFVAWRDADGIAGQIIGSTTNITTAQAERDELEELVRHDTLTGLRSRAYCNLEMEHIEQNDIRPVCVISLDITGLKMVNDNLGHMMGDEMLTKAATILRGSLRRSDCIGRVGGDEFIVLLPNCGEEKGKKLLNKIKAAFDQYNSTKHGMPVFAAMGLSCADSMKTRLAEVIVRADDAMYENKRRYRKEHHAALRAWIKQFTGKDVSDQDERVDD